MLLQLLYTKTAIKRESLRPELVASRDLSVHVQADASRQCQCMLPPWSEVWWSLLSVHWNHHYQKVSSSIWVWIRSQSNSSVPLSHYKTLSTRRVPSPGCLQSQCPVPTLPAGGLMAEPSVDTMRRLEAARNVQSVYSTLHCKLYTLHRVHSRIQHNFKCPNFVPRVQESEVHSIMSKQLT